MSEIYFVRHGQASFGSGNYDQLSALGHRQSVLLGEYFAARGLQFDQLLAGHDPAGVVHHCGSGVSTVPNIVAMELAGYPPVALYAGSWSEWCRTEGLPVAKG